MIGFFKKKKLFPKYIREWKKSNLENNCFLSFVLLN